MATPETVGMANRELDCALERELFARPVRYTLEIGYAASFDMDRGEWSEIPRYSEDPCAALRVAEEIALEDLGDYFADELADLLGGSDLAAGEVLHRLFYGDRAFARAVSEAALGAVEMRSVADDLACTEAEAFPTA